MTCEGGEGRIWGRVVEGCVSGRADGKMCFVSFEGGLKVSKGYI